MKKVIILESLKRVLGNRKTILSREDLMVFTASGAEEILQLHRLEQADLIITDLDGQGAGGERLCSLIRGDENLKKVSIIMAYSPESPLLETYRACGANMFIEKPIDRTFLLRKIGEFFSIAERESIRELIKISVRVEAGDDFFFASSRNISSSGMLIEGDKPLSRGDSITCSFYLDRQVTLEGTVIRTVRIEPELFHYGIRFTAVDPDSRQLIEEFVENRK